MRSRSLPETTRRAEIAARQMGFMPLRDALGLVALYASEGSPKYDKAATRWLARLALESNDFDLRLVRPSYYPAVPREDSEATGIPTTAPASGSHR